MKTIGQVMRFVHQAPLGVSLRKLFNPNTLCPAICIFDANPFPALNVSSSFPRSLRVGITTLLASSPGSFSGPAP